MKWLCRLQSFEKIEILLLNGNDEIIWISKATSKIFWPHFAKVQSTRRRAIYLQKRFQFYLITNLGPFSVLLQYIYWGQAIYLWIHSVDRTVYFFFYKRCFHTRHEICFFFKPVVLKDSVELEIRDELIMSWIRKQEYTRTCFNISKF